MQSNLAELARTIAKYEPVSMLVRRSERATAQRLLRGANVTLVEGDLDDLWMRDTGPSFVVNSAMTGERGGVQFNFNGWGDKQVHTNDAQVAALVARYAGIPLLHTDFYARFASPGVALAGFDPDPQSYDHAVTKAHLQILRSAVDTRGKKHEVLVLQAPEAFSQRDDATNFAAGYIGFYVCNGAVISQKFGDARADRAAKRQLQQAFGGRLVEPLQMDAIAAGGGSVHCATQQDPRT